MLNFRRYAFEVGGERTPLSAGWKKINLLKQEKITVTPLRKCLHQRSI